MGVLGRVSKFLLMVQVSCLHLWRENCTHGFLKFYFKCVHFLAHSTIIGLGPGAVGMTGPVGAGV